jgi:hypothetical protein
MSEEDRPMPVVKDEIAVKQEQQPDATMETPATTELQEQAAATTDVAMGETSTSYGKQRLNMYPVTVQNLPAEGELVNSGMIPAGWFQSDISYVQEWRKEITAQVRKYILFRDEQFFFGN